MKWLAIVQGSYYLLTGMWGVVHRPSFEAVTGPKTDYWLVVMVGLLVCVIGATLLYAARFSAAQPVTFVLAMTSAAAFAVADIVFVLNETIGPVYLLDSGLQIGFVALWLWLAFRQRGRSWYVPEW
jgi:hypothetical protein